MVDMNEVLEAVDETRLWPFERRDPILMEEATGKLGLRGNGSSPFDESGDNVDDAEVEIPTQCV